jgi:tetratricopeptide (TPR) repeat protein
MKKTPRVLILTSLLISLPTVLAQAMTESDLMLKRSQPVIRDLKGGEAHSYRLKLNAGQYAEITVRQRNIDVIVGVFDAAGKSLGEYDSPTGLGGIELARFVADTTGMYRIVARALKTEAYGGSYEIEVKAIRKATAQDKRIVTAIKAQILADELRAKDATRHQSLEQYARALRLWRAARDRASEASTLRAIGFAYVRLGDDDQAYQHFNQSLTIWRALSDRRSEAYIHLIFATIHTRRGALQKAVEERLLALALWRALGDQIEEASALSVIGLGYARLREKAQAWDYGLQSLAVSRASGNLSLQANTLTWFGSICEMFGEKEQALDYFQQSLALWRAMGRRSQEADLRQRIEKLKS